MFETDLQHFQYLDKYSKYDYDKGRRETWEETIVRATEFLRELSENKLPKHIYEDIYTAMYNGDVSPSMRLFSAAGGYARKNNAAIYNCCYLPIDCITAMAEIIWLSISGCGIGFSVEKHNIEKLPVVEKEVLSDLFYKIPDTSEGWFQSTLSVISAAFDGARYNFDYTQIRPSGTPIKTKGGYASGPEILQEIHTDIYKWIRNAVGRQLTSLEVHDICTRLADAGISGGVRRAAMISFFDENDTLMHSCKNGNFWETAPWRANANNSVILLEEHYTKERLAEIMSNLWENGSGEPGIIFPRNLQNRSPSWRNFEFGLSQTRTNPCQPGFVKLLTPNGVRTLDEIDVGSVIWSEDGWVTVVNKVHTGKKPVRQYDTTYGRFYGTNEHRIVSNGLKIEAVNAESFDALSGGLSPTDIDEKNAALIYRTYSIDEVVSADATTIAHYLRGLFDVEGSVFDGHPQVSLVKNIAYATKIQLLLSIIGIRSFIMFNGIGHIIRIIKDASRFAYRVGFSAEEKNDMISQTIDDTLLTGGISMVFEMGILDVYDITVDGNSHTYWCDGLNVSNCGEITLEGTPVEVNGGGGEFCNLSSVNCYAHDTIDTLAHKTFIATIIGDIQSLATNFPILRPVWAEKCRKDRLLGVNHTGHANCSIIRNPETQIFLKEVVHTADEWFSDFMSVPLSCGRISCKPSGNSSVLYGLGPGMNPIHAKISLRNVVVNINTAIYNFLVAQGVPQIDYPNSTHKALFSFPIRFNDNDIILSDTTAVEQCEYWKLVTLNLMEHNASCSITYEVSEIPLLQNWIYENQNIIGGQAFFPRFDANYPYLPIYEIDEDAYAEAVKNFPKINWDNFYLYEHPAQETNTPLECSGERCDVSY